MGRTTDGGETWLINKNQIPYNVLRYNQIISKAKYSFSERRFYSFKDSINGWCMVFQYDSSKIGDKPRTVFISKTTDGGANWSKLLENRIAGIENTPTSYEIYCFQFCMYYDLNGVLFNQVPLRTSNGGKHGLEIL